MNCWFSLTDNDIEWDDAIQRRKLGEISEPVRAVFRTLQPNNRPHEVLPPILRILRTLNNADKHRLLRLVYGAMVKGNMGFVSEESQEGRNWRNFVNPFELTDGAEVFAMICDRSAPNMRFDRTEMEIAVSISHGKRSPADPEGSDRSTLTGLLDILYTEVRAVVYTFGKV